MDKSIFHPIGPVGSILIGLVLSALHLFKVALLGWLGLAFMLGGLIMLMTRIFAAKKQLPK